MKNENAESDSRAIQGESAKLLFELSNEDRLRMLSILEKKEDEVEYFSSADIIHDPRNFETSGKIDAFVAR